MKVALDAWSAGSLPATEGDRERDAVGRSASGASDGRIAERDDRSVRRWSEAAQARFVTAAITGDELKELTRCLTNRARLRAARWPGKRNPCGARSRGSGCFCLTISFVWLVRLPRADTSDSRASRRARTRRAAARGGARSRAWGADSGAMCGTILEKDLTLDVALTGRIAPARGRLYDCPDAR